MIEPTHVIVLDEVADDMNEGKIFLISKRFPYAIYYDISDKVVRVVAVLPMRRDPAWIKKKLTGRG